MTNAYQSDVYSFTGTAGEPTTSSSSASPTVYYGSSCYLYGPNNAYITSSSYGKTSRRLCRPPATTPWWSTTTAATARRTYSFEAIQNVNPTSAMTLGTEVNGTIANPGDSHTYTFTGTAGQRLYYDALASCSTYSFAELTDPYGNAFFNTSASSNEGPYTLTYSGTYTLTIYSYGNQRATGAYAFTLDDASTATNIALTPGSGTTETRHAGHRPLDQPLPVQRHRRPVPLLRKPGEFPHFQRLRHPLQPKQRLCHVLLPGE